PYLKARLSVRSTRPPPQIGQNPTLTIGDTTYDCDGSDLKFQSYLGHGAFGMVEEREHLPSKTRVAVKRITLTANDEEKRRVVMDLDVIMRSIECPYTVQFYGALFLQGDVWICMERMEASLDHLYKKLKKHDENIPEDVLGKIVLAVMHRDVKPSNILINLQGEVKVCDFGISGSLINSTVCSHVGSALYMAPERIDPSTCGQGYGIRSDVWSLGITVVELATNNYPFSWTNAFQMMKQVVQEDPPSLPTDRFSTELQDFVAQCLQKNVEARPKYKQLLEHPFLKRATETQVDLKEYIGSVIERYGPLNETPK
ncbi:hypothetical protein BaRGS_00015929, partial [Batillaria attramentaria]